MVLGDLLDFVDNAEKDSVDVQIAEALLKERRNLDSLSLDKLAERYYISQASFSRFMKRMGFSNYSDFKSALVESQAYMDQLYTDTARKKITVTEVKDEVYDNILSALHVVHEKSSEDLLKVIHTLDVSHTVIFAGSSLSMSILRILELALSADDKVVEMIHLIPRQVEKLKTLKEDDIFIAVSLEGRWYSSLKERLDVSELKCRKMLWTIDPDHEDQEKFDDTVIFGETAEMDYGYNEYMYFVMLIYQLYRSRKRLHSENE